MSMEKKTGLVRTDLVVAHCPCQASLCYPYYLRSVHSVPYSRVQHHDRKEPRANSDDNEWCLRSAIASPCRASKT